MYRGVFFVGVVVCFLSSVVDFGSGRCYFKIVDDAMDGSMFVFIVGGRSFLSGIYGGLLIV